ncbi:integrase core domain-containing protein [Streptomyces edwardsiae]|uniref:Integrase core domain-containing protein n=1 Tax=Streptomyces edwardsiae TaxID=3075527 RepID=A0ABU2Q961_9ACTN|nr:integrase core domain-containing protein [Streptomyces sp. DSM 41636]MDT0400040.1 integrase core domain-containing protein [Streptomyces sp. DSM 41636]
MTCRRGSFGAYRGSGDARPWSSNSPRTRALDRFLDHYNTRRGHSALEGRPPSRLAA